MPRLTREQKHLKEFKQETERIKKSLVSKYKPTDKKQLAVRGMV